MHYFAFVIELICTFLCNYAASWVKGLTHNTEYWAVKINNTKQPIRFYGYNSERIFADDGIEAKSGIQFDIQNSSNIEIYYFKTEAKDSGTTLNGRSVPLSIKNSNNLSSG